MSINSRRSFLKQTGVASLGFLGLQTFLANLGGCHIPEKIQTRTIGYGPLYEDLRGILNLPLGFKYKIIAQRGEKMSDGLVHPDKPDGMATFQGPDGRIILVRNHELLPTDQGAFGESKELLDKISKSKFYDFGHGKLPGMGGTTTLVINEKNLKVEKSFLSLAGTTRNCAGGPTPWNSWITCEEIFENAEGHREKGHGYNFEVPATSSPMLAEPIPLTEMGKFNHEAVCVDPKSSIVYQTEDMHDGLIYRYIPNKKQELSKGGQLQVLAILDQDSVDTRNWKSSEPVFPQNEPFKVRWIDIEQKDFENDNLRHEGFEMGAAKFARGEGMWFGNNEVYFACTNGGKDKKGQIFRYIPSEFEGTPDEKNAPGTLELFLEPNDSNLLNYCDNLTVSPFGDVIMCEDHENARILGVNPYGDLYTLGHNVGYKSEMAGCVFSPSGKTLFVNIQHAGLTVAIQGPWDKQVS